MSITTLMTLAKSEAKRLQQAGPQASCHSPQLMAAVEQVWAMVKPRLGEGAAAEELDRLICSLTGRVR
jgi:hypothetical protein